MKPALLVLPAALCALCALPAYAVDVGGRADRTTPYVTTPYPAARATVYLLKYDGREWRAISRTTTDPGGMYYFAKLSTGRYIVQIEGHNFPFKITAEQPAYQEIRPALVDLHR